MTIQTRFEAFNFHILYIVNISSLLYNDKSYSTCMNALWMKTTLENYKLLCIIWYAGNTQHVFSYIIFPLYYFLYNISFYCTKIVLLKQNRQHFVHLCYLNQIICYSGWKKGKIPRFHFIKTVLEIKYRGQYNV